MSEGGDYSKFLGAYENRRINSKISINYQTSPSPHPLKSTGPMGTIFAWGHIFLGWGEGLVKNMGLSSLHVKEYVYPCMFEGGRG